MPLDLLADFAWRGLIHQCTDEPGLRGHLAAGPRRMYAGFDPTAPSLTIGNLVPLMLLKRAQLAGHVPVALQGGATGMIGDPSGKTAERDLAGEERVRANVAAQRPIFERVLGTDGPAAAILVNNLDWLGPITFLQALRDIGKHFSVNQMIQRDSVRTRLEGRDHGISYTEFSYVLLQAYDFLHLHRAMGVTVQMGGSDQWGNIVSGTDLIRRAAGVEASADPAASGATGTPAFGLTCPLITKADGTKFGKTESGAIWLTADRTSPYAYYQFWLNASDEDVGRFLRFFTLMGREEVEALEAEHARDPGKRAAQRALARAATDLLHGADERQRAEAAAAALFSGELASLPAALLDEVLAAAPATTHPRAALEGDGLALLDLLPQTTLAKSKTEARQFLTEGSVSVNGRKAAPTERITAATLLHGRVIALRRGKKHWHVTRWE